MGLTSSLQAAANSLEIYTSGIQVAGSNVANANTPDYIREDMTLGTAPSYQTGGLTFGTGAQVNSIRQQIDLNLESQIHQANADAGSAAARVNGYDQLELILSELSGRDLSSKLNEFVASVNELVNQPELIANRQIVIQQGENLAGAINTTREQIDRVRTGITSEIEVLAKEANTLIDQIAFLNKRIIQMESAGLSSNDAGALRSNRLSAMNRLSEIIPVKSIEAANGKVDLFTGSDYLIIEGTVQHLETYRTADKGVATNQLRFSRTKADVPLSKGELSGLIEARDKVLGGFVSQLDQYAGAVIQQVNLIHSSGEGQRGFTDITSATAVDQSNVVLNQAGLNFSPVHGSFEIKIYDSATDTIQTTQINIDLDGIGGNDTTLDSLMADLDAISNLNASIDTLGRLKLTTDTGYDVRFSNDSSGTLAALGINTFFTGNDSSNMAVNQTIIDNPDLLAVGTGGGPGDNSTAIKLANFMENPVASLSGNSIDKFYLLVTSQIAESASAESAMADGFDAFRASLFGQRQQISGVSIDEEAIKIMQYQNGYTAAARIISIIDELFTTLLNI
ncbi:MAG: flagellar hook-associated protein FlgK [Planctomycetaceae bacterium]|nr:flagellar hook-associated protein FlgK [Planctomycetaceae bacterium]